jgi:hypothetical protein
LSARGRHDENEAASGSESSRNRQSRAPLRIAASPSAG